MDFALDQEINRMGTHSTKWEFVVDGEERRHTDEMDPKYGDERLLPLWVADMDFRSPPAVIEALVARAQHGVFGYSNATPSYYNAVMAWLARRYGRTVKKEWITLSPGVVPAINMLVEALAPPGDKVLVQRPVYYPFFTAIENNEATLVSNTLRLENGRYQMDFDDLAAKAADPAVKMAILCHPHNPVGRVWTREELTRFGEICLENDVLVISDEIHGDLIHSGRTFTSFATISEEFEQRSIVCTAASKTFNLPGLKTANIIIPDPKLREAFAQAQKRHGIGGGNPFGLAATEAAYRHGESWLAAVMAYVEENTRFLADYLADHLPQMQLIPPEGTYLAWVDCTGLGLEPEARKALLFEEAKVYLDEGRLFGPEGADFERFNLACPRSLLAEALTRIKTAVEDQGLGQGV